MPAVAIQSIIHCLGFSLAHSAATHGVVEHAVALFPRPHLLVVRNIVQDGGVAIFPVEWTAHERPQHTRNRRAIDDRTLRCNPDNAIRIGITQFTEQSHMSAIIFPAGLNLSAVIAPRMFFAGGDSVPGGRLTSPARGQNDCENEVTFSHWRDNVAKFPVGKMLP